MSSYSLEKGYDPAGIEDKWYKYWLEKGFFVAEEKSDKQPYSIVIPPPNVTGVLHMGHALNITIQDIMCRFRRLCGDNVLWMPGTDHAGIATQNVVERNLAKQNITRDQLGREKFIEAVWQWREESGGAIINQLKKIGASCDWARERFTMDKGLSDAVRKVFVRLYKDNLIYQGQYIINWCPRCRTALADLEVEHEDNDGFLYYIQYPFVNKNDGVVVATTRPETLFGDTAVAINPNDERYINLSENRVVLPLINRIIPIIRDEYVDIQFGTGVLKVTPAHDLNDFNLGEKHGLERLKVIDDEGIMNEHAGDYKGLDRFKCRTMAVEALDKLGLLVKKEPLKNSIGHCYRCKTIIEPSLSRQWFVKAGPLAKVAADAVRDGKTRIIPSNWTKTYFEWLDNIQDWCISRQIWWGHRIPVWKCHTCGEVMVEEFDPNKCDACGSLDISQETDVLDTWFSSALWPFSTMGWPEETDLLKTFYPTSALVTGFDILFFWVARMMMMGTRFMGEVPFKDVYIHALVRDEHGKKMSKSKGNVIDPLKIIDHYGADAFRFTLAAFAAQGRDVRMSEERVEGYRNFINKLWNAARFTMMHLQNDVTQPVSSEKNIVESIVDESVGLQSTEPLQLNIINISDKAYSTSELWILSRCAATAETVKSGIENYRFNEAANAIYQFVWHEFCDWYLEAAKPALYEKEGRKRRDASRTVLAKVLKDILIMLHPFMPFVTEEIWQVLPTVQGSVMEARFPTEAILQSEKRLQSEKGLPLDNDADYTFRNIEVENKMEFIVGLIYRIRNIRGEMNIQPSMQLNVIMHTSDDAEKQIIIQNSSLIENLSRLESLIISDNADAPAACATGVVMGTTIYVSLKGVIDFDKEIHRLEKEIEKVTKELILIAKRLTNESFLDKAPDDVVQKVKEQQAMLQEKNEKLNINLKKILTTQA